MECDRLYGRQLRTFYDVRATNWVGQPQSIKERGCDYGSRDRPLGDTEYLVLPTNARDHGDQH